MCYLLCFVVITYLCPRTELVLTKDIWYGLSNKVYGIHIDVSLCLDQMYQLHYYI